MRFVYYVPIMVHSSSDVELTDKPLSHYDAMILYCYLYSLFDTKFIKTNTTMSLQYVSLFDVELVALLVIK